MNRVPAKWFHSVSLGTTPRLATFIFNYVQLGLVVAVATSFPERKELVLVLLGFELGILADCFIRRGSMGVWSWVAGLSSCGLMLLALPVPPTVAVTGGMLSAGLFAFSLKKIRTATDALGRIKRRWRAFGYLCAGLYTPAAVFALVVALMAAVHLSRVSELEDKPAPVGFSVRPDRLRPYAVVMLHHVHYFSYAYLLMLILHSRYEIESTLLGPLFYVGWAGYYLFIHAKRHRRLLVVAGHVLSGASVFLLVSAESLGPILALWFLTGVGGGTIVLLREVNIAGDGIAYERFKTWEAFGHVVGLSALVSAVFADVDSIAFAVGGLAGLACGVGASVRSSPGGTSLADGELPTGAIASFRCGPEAHQ